VLCLSQVEKRVKAHHKKAAKAAKKNPLYRSKLKKDPGVPNLYPFKDRLLAMVKEDHEVEQAGKARMRKEAQSLAQLASDAGGSLAKYEKQQGEQRAQESARSNLIPQTERESSRKAFFREFKKVVEESDVILEVLDARDPIGCRARAVEQAILAKGDKKVVLVLNKIDLVPREVVAAWLKHLRQEFPTVAFRCNTQLQKANLSRGKGDFDTYESLSGGTCLGGDNLLELLKNYCRSQNLKKSITVGIIGYPNTGKSSLINSLKRSKAAAVGAKPGFTRTMQEIKLDTNVVLLDCPGIVFSSGEGSEFGAADIVLRNAVEVEKITDPVWVIGAVLKRCPRERLMELYQIPVYRSADEFLAFVAHKIGKLKKGGIPDYHAAAVSVLRDWQSGKIKFYTMPPERNEAIVSSEIVTQWAKEFDLDALLEKEESIVGLLPMELEGTMRLTHGAPRSDAGFASALERPEEMDEDDDDEEVEDGDEEDGADDMEVSSDQSDEYAEADAAKGAMVMVMPPPKAKGGKRREEAEEADGAEAQGAAMSRGKKNKQLKRQQKRNAVGRTDMEEDDDEGELVAEGFDFDAFEPVAISNQKPDPEEFQFRY
jgi:nuclear GTP-binding protein